MKPNNVAKDFLTNCYVREGIGPFLKRMEEEFLSFKRPFAILIMDVDHFKSFNDKYGHMYGDEVLKYFSSSLRLDLEDEENVPFRFGGDEFVMIFPNKTAAQAFELAERLKKNIHSRSCLIKGKQLSVTFSGGIAGFPENANNTDDVMEKADKALYFSKNHGRDRVTKYSDLHQKEMLQIILIAVFLSIVGALVFFNRDFLASKTNSLSKMVGAWSLSRPSKPAPVTTTPATTSPAEPMVSTPTPAEAQVPAPAEESVSEILLESGRTLRGIIEHEDADVIELKLGLQEGSGVIQVKKSQVARIRKIPAKPAAG